MITMSRKASKRTPIRALSLPRIQFPVASRAESFTARRCLDRGNFDKAAAFDAPYHFHPEIELLLMETGSGTRYVADSVEHYKPGDLVLIGANVPHVFVRDEESGPAASIVVHFREDFLGKNFFSRPEMHGIQRLLGRSGQGLHYGTQTARRFAPRLLDLLRLQGVPRLLVLLDLLDRLAEAPARALATNGFRQKIREEDLVRIDRVRAFVEARYHEEIEMADAAKIASLSPASFSRWFSRATGNTFVEYLTNTRMAHAYHALIETGKTVTEIAFDCGFNSVSHFIHRFRAIRGVSPLEFKRQVEADTPEKVFSGESRS
jgi:AraC-like DNA-binding protein/mannose-6-phosphate isomerase-like protein (cupin superfamily)